MSKQISFSKEAREKLLSGVNQLADAVVSLPKWISDV